MTDPDTLVDTAEIARRLEVTRGTVYAWRTRAEEFRRRRSEAWRAFPLHSASYGGRPVWRWEDVERWARETGRL